MPAIFTVDPHTGVPIYLQIIEQVKRSVALGVLVAGDRLPTVKQLAFDLTVNPNTVARAYRELERDGIIETNVGRGSFVSTHGATARAATDLIEVSASALDSVVREARSLGVRREQLNELFVQAVDRWYSSNGETKEPETP
jgi:GntR family transcriptional regulator